MSGADGRTVATPRAPLASLQTRVVLLVVGTVVGLALLVLVSVLYVTRRESQRSVERDFRTTNTILRQTLASQTTLMETVSRSIVDRTGTFMANIMKGPQKPGDRDPRTDWPTVSDAAEEVRLQLDANEVVITDRAGRVIGDSSGDVRQRGVSMAAQRGYSVAMAGKSWHGVVMRDDHLAIAVSVPIPVPGQLYVQGTVTTFLWIGTPLSQTVARALNCDVVFLSNGQIVGSSGDFTTLPPLPDIVGHSAISPPFEVLSSRGRYIATYQTVRFNRGDEPFGVLILRPYAEATALRQSLEAGLVAPVFLSLFVALTIATMVARGITTPLDSVVAAARELREGRWPRQFDVRQSDEIGLLQTVFNEMSISLRAAQERLIALIDTDPLTELDNHRRFQERWDGAVAHARISGENLSLLLIGLDHFHAFNQKEGHAHGDAALKTVAATVAAALPPSGVAARYGGEIFAVIAPNLRTEETAALAERIRAAIAAIPGDDLRASVGFAELGRGVVERDSVTLAAELALTQAKQLGRNRVCGFDAVAETAAGDAALVDPVPLHRFLRDGSLSTIQALAAAVDAKDPYTQGHSRRVAELAQQMAKRQGLTTDETYLVFTTGTLHDVGKIGVPDQVLQKAGRLDAEERRLMETHPVLGEVIVGKAPQLSGVLPGVRSHHERWDGKGYPDGLAGEAIPLIARILALADTYDAMTSDRPYRNGLSPEIALAEISRNAGTQFDPRLAPEFVAMIREIMDAKP